MRAKDSSIQYRIEMVRVFINGDGVGIWENVR